MTQAHRLNPNGMLVLLGAAMYAIVGGPMVVAGGFTIAMMLAALNRPDGESRHRGGPPSLFGALEPSPAHIRLVAPPLALVYARASIQPVS